VDGIPQTGRARYLSIHIYPGSDRWMLAVLLKETGTPYPRLIRTVYRGKLEGDTSYLSQAATQAAMALLSLFPPPPRD